MNYDEKCEINHIKKVIPINNDLVNFTADISITGSTKFLMAIVDRDTYETSADIDYKDFDQVQVTVRNDDSKYKCFLLIIKSDKPQEVSIKMNTEALPLDASKLQKELQSTPGIAPNSNELYKRAGALQKEHFNSTQRAQVSDEPPAPTPAPAPTPSGGAWYESKIYWIIVGLILVAIVYYIFYMQKKRSDRRSSRTTT